MGSFLSRRNLVLAAALLSALALRAKLRKAEEDFIKFQGARPAVGTTLGSVSTLTIFPVKSCQGINVSSVKISSNGMEFDRLVMIINKNKIPITQRMIPQLAQVKISLFKDAQTVSVEPPQSTHVSPLDLQLEGVEGKRIRVDLHSIPCDCVDYGDDKAEWLDQMLTALTGKEKKGFRFVRIQQGETRRIQTSPVRLLTRGTKAYDGTYLSDLAPLTLTSEASLRKLNDNIDDDVIPMDRFRSNIVMKADRKLAFVEDECSKIKVGTLNLRVIGPTFRCVIPSVCQRSGKHVSVYVRLYKTVIADTGEAGFRKNIREAEPIATLKRLRSGGLRYGLTGILPVTMGGSKSLAPIFGVYLGVQEESDEVEIRLGDKLSVQAY